MIESLILILVRMIRYINPKISEAFFGADENENFQYRLHRYDLPEFILNEVDLAFDIDITKQILDREWILYNSLFQDYLDNGAVQDMISRKNQEFNPYIQELLKSSYDIDHHHALHNYSENNTTIHISL